MKKQNSNKENPNWLILIHHYPKKPGSLRVKIWRRLQSVGAIPIKNALYILPLDDQTREDFEWILKEIISGGAEGAILEAQFVEGMDDNQIKALFNEARDQDYAVLAKDVSSLQVDLKNKINLKDDHLQNLEGYILKFKKRLWEIDNVDFFGANGREAVEGIIKNLSNLRTDQPDPIIGKAENEIEKCREKSGLPEKIFMWTE